MHRRILKVLKLTFSLLALVLSVAAFAKNDAKPNIVIILADDMGFSDVGCYGGEIHTPNLDKLAEGGLRFTQFYNTARCWPSRAAILTGYYAQQVGRDALPGLGGGANGKRPEWAKLLPQMLKPLGYRSYHCGKWHVDGPVLNGGFDHSYSLNDHDRHFNPKRHTVDDEPLPAVKPNSGYYTTTAIAQHAIDMLSDHKKQHSEEPFFLYLAFTSPHWPIQAPPHDIAVYTNRYVGGWDALRAERYDKMKNMGLVHCPLSKLDPDIIPSWNFSEAKLRDLIGPGAVAHAVPWDTLTPEQKQFQPILMSVHAAMVHRMDIEIGRVVDQLKSIGAFDNTVIFFLSDNGASAEQMIRGDGNDKTAAPGSAKSFLSIGPGWASAANTPFRLHKSWVHEGGITTPLIVHWPNGIRARGELRENPGHVIDLAPTILQLAGEKKPARNPSAPVPPGKSLVPAFTHDNTVKHDSFWWYHEGNRALRVGDWKLVADHKNPWELYDLRTDRSESINLAAKNPDRVKQMDQEWKRQMETFSHQIKASRNKAE
jgi:arylsulfatase